MHGGIQVGIKSHGVYLPAQFMTSCEVAVASGLPVEVVEEKLGFLRKPVPGPDDHTVAMGVKAARIALERAGVAAEAIDLIIYIGEEYKEHWLQTGAVKLQKGIGATRAWGFDFQLRCGTMVAALPVAADLMRANPDLRLVLLAGGYRNGDLVDYRNPRVRFMYNLGAGGAAVLLERGLGRNRVLAGSVVTDPLLADAVGVVAGGTCVPLSEATWRQGLYALEVFDPEGMKARLDQVSTANFVRVIAEAATRSGYGLSDIGYLCLLHMKRSAHREILRAIGLPPERSTYLQQYGHIGQLDQIISLEEGLARGAISDGMLVMMASAGIGYAWAAAAIAWGKKADSGEGVHCEAGR
jgi:3-oxoacyl-[acyl-carrier-protein] synthase-3